MSKISSIYLSKAEYDRLMKVCEKEGCTSYSLVKRVLLDHIGNYPLEDGPVLETDVETHENESEEPIRKDQTVEIEAEDVSGKVKEILQERTT